MGIKRIKQYLLLIVSISIFILILCCLPKFVEISLIYTMPIAVISSLTPTFVQEAIKMLKNFIGKKKKEEKQRKHAQTSLRCSLDTIIKSLNIDNVRHPSAGLAHIKLPNRPDHKFPPDIENKIIEYNEKAELLIKLSYGCERFVRDTVTKNVLQRLYNVNGSTFQWVPGVSASEGKLSEFLSEWLTREILLGRTIDKPRIDSISPIFFKKIDDLNSSEEFALFLRDLNEEIESQRKKGCLNLFTWTHEEVKKLAEDLQSDVRVQK